MLPGVEVSQQLQPCSEPESAGLDISGPEDLDRNTATNFTSVRYR